MTRLMTWIVYWMGKPRFMQAFRHWYWRTHGGVWFWGIQGFVRDMQKMHAHQGYEEVRLTMSHKDYFSPIRFEEDNG